MKKGQAAVIAKSGMQALEESVVASTTRAVPPLAGPEATGAGLQH